MIDTGSQLENVIIIGGGVAGLSAAVYNSRADLFPLLFAGSPPGGQLTLTSEVENFPGFESILGSELIEKMRKQAQKFGTRIIDEN
ncbi:MAG: thioredoxin-disulfide reductase, partial [bacterium]|nr:thioredoxin-disulfide reductase [bacterium]